MGKVLKFFTASVLVATLTLTTIICCCLGPTAMAHFSKKALCSHCDKSSSSQHKDCDPSSSCQHRLTDADISSSHAIVLASDTLSAFLPVSFIDHHINLAPSFPTIYSRGSPPIIHTTPLYIQFRNLRL
ncbi:MAG: hypothetical protein ACRDE8_07220 [Ginsengibacter sp.]